MSNFKTVLAIGAAALLLASCGRADQPAETEAPDVSAEVEVAPEPEPDNTEALADAHGSYHSGGYQSESEPENDEISDAEINAMALEITWDSQSALDQEDFCWGWDYDQAMMVDAFMSGSGGAYTSSEVRSFFNGKC